MRWLAIPLLVAGVVLCVDASADDASSTRTEARQRFDRGLKLFNRGDNGGALAEFKRAYELVQHPLVLMNIGLVNAAMSRPVAAVEALDEVLEHPEALTAEKLERVRRTREEQAGRIGMLDVEVNVPEAGIEVDNVQVGKAPLKAPLQVTAGRHILAVVAPGYIPLRQEVVVAAKQTKRLSVNLRPLEGVGLGQLSITTNIPDVEVRLDDVLVGRTPLPTTLALAPGNRRIELRREGYRTVKKVVPIGQGVTGELTIELEPDPSSTAWGRLRLSISESDAVVFVDGKVLGTYREPLELPAGSHQVRVERADFFPYERRVRVQRGSTTELKIDLEPTPEKRAAYVEAADRHLMWGWIGVGVGAAVAAGGGLFLVVNQGAKDEAERDFDDYADEFERAGGACERETPRHTAACDRELRRKLRDLEDTRDRDLYGWVGLGVGAATLITGALFLATGDDPDRYEPSDDSDVFQVRLTPTWHPSGVGVGASGRF